MKPRPKVAWTEGLLMTPQHLQQQDLYHEAQAATRMAALEPLAHGVISLELDSHALHQRSAGLASFQGVLPDGMLLWLGAGYPLPVPRSVEGHFPPSQEALEVFVGVPKERSGANNFGTESDLVRYNVQSRQVFDVAADDEKADVNFAAPNAVLLFGDEDHDAHVTLKIAELTRDANGELAVSDSYMPPCLRINAAPVFAMHLSQLLAKMVTRHRTLTEARRHAGEGRLEFTAADVTRYLQLNALNGSLPLLHYLLDAGDVTPRAAFLMLSQLAGQLASFSTMADMTQPMRFDHNDLRATFRPLFTLLDSLLSVTDAEQFVTCTLKAHGNTFVGELTDDRLPRCERYLFAVETPLPRAHVIDEFIGKAKIASHADIDIVTLQAIRGVPVEPNKHLPPQIPPRPGVVYFDVAVDKDFVYWKHVWQDRNVEVRMPPSFDRDKTKIQLLGVVEAQRG